MGTATQLRQPAGVPAGGRFAGRDRCEADVLLSAPPRQPSPRVVAALASRQELEATQASGQELQEAYREEIAARLAEECPAVIEVYLFHNAHTGSADHLLYTAEEDGPVEVHLSEELHTTLGEAGRALCAERPGGITLTARS